MSKLKSRIIVVAVAILIVIIIIIINMLNSTYNCYESKTDDGFIVRTGIELIEDYSNNIRYEEISINR